MNRYDPIIYFDQGGSGLGDMKLSPDGDYVQFDHAMMEVDRWKGYAISLQRAIEHSHGGQVIPTELFNECPHHAQMLTRLRVEIGELTAIKRAAVCEYCKYTEDECRCSSNDIP